MNGIKNRGINPLSQVTQAYTVNHQKKNAPNVSVLFPAPYKHMSLLKSGI